MSAGAGDDRAGGATREAIEHHYDVGRDFFGLWLDRRMVYSCALWEGDPDEDLEAAQLAKLSWHAAAAKAQGAAHVLDIGCGWGAMVRYLREECGVAHVTGLTLSSDQAAAAADGPGTEVILEDWRRHQPAHGYDAIISIGAFEHFARMDLDQAERRAVYGQFFDRCADWLPAEGRLSLQTIAWEDLSEPGLAAGPGASFFTEDIFPESALPKLSDVVTACERRFRLVHARSDADHYSQTLRLWQQRLEANKEAAQALVGRDTYRRYLRYLRVSRAMFDRRACTLYRLVLERRPGTAPFAASWA
jgi:cyclopropane-fatty-acyl-phospholipid synthase